MFSRKPKRGRPSYDSYRRGGFGIDWDLSDETKKGIFIILLFLLGTLSVLGLFDLAGEFGRFIVYILALIFGSLKWTFPIVLIVFGYFLLREDKYEVKFINYLGAILLLFGLTSIWHLKYDPIIAFDIAKDGMGGGYLGASLAVPFLKILGFWGAIVVCLALIFSGLLLMFETSLYGLMWPIKLFKFLGQKFYEAYLAIKEKMDNRSANREEGDYEEDEDDEEEEDEEVNSMEDEDIPSDDGEEESLAPQFEKRLVSDVKMEVEEKAPAPKKFGKKIDLPLDLLTSKSGKPTSGDIKANQEIVKKTLANFKIDVEMADVNVGPTVTQYTFRPADGVKLSRITNLNSDLALALAAHPIRIEAPIPGKSLVGVEIPNQAAAKVTMKDLLSSKEFKGRSNDINIALGKDVSGKSCFAPIDKMPHLLIAGATGSGKSVCINSLIVSLLYQNSPDELKFILVDPKRVELPLYNNIPYLLTPVITDVKKTINALKWTVSEMESRFDLLSKKGKRNIESYNKDNPKDKLPYIVFVIDELADLMSVAASDVEAGIVRLAQMARAVGIHLVLATQRPSVEVITGLIKANIPGRIAFSVASLIDSRTILDTSGAEKLVGRGDMLYLGPDVTKPKRIQGVFLADREIKNIINHIKSQGTAEYTEGITEKQGNGSMATGGGGFSDDDGDALLGEAKEVIMEAGKASASLLQRRLKVGYARAARILDLLEDQGVIGPADGAKPREVFLDQMGGNANPVEFAAHEHGLEGELVSESDVERSEIPSDDGEQTPTVFKQEEIPDKTDEDEEEFDEEEIEEVDSSEDEDIPSDDEEEELEEEDEEEEEEKPKSKKVFDDDEWT